MTLNDQAILAEWSKQRDNEDGDEWRWRLGDPPDDICEAYCCVADAADAAAASLRMGGRGGGGSVVVIDRVEGGGRRDGRQSPTSIVQCDEPNAQSLSNSSAISSKTGTRRAASTYHKRHSRTHGLRKLGVTEDNVALAEKLLDQISGFPINKAERILGFATARMKHDKGIQMLGATEDKVAVEIPKVLGSLGVAGRRRSYTLADCAAPEFIFIPELRRSSSYPCTEQRRTNHKTEERRRSCSPMARQPRPTKYRWRWSSETDVTANMIRQLRNQAKISLHEIDALKAQIAMLERRLTMAENDRKTHGTTNEGTVAPMVIETLSIVS